MGGNVHIRIKHRGVLGDYGYHDVVHMTRDQRRAALRRASRVLGWLYLIRKLNALYVLNKNHNPKVAELFKEDRIFASEKYAASKKK